MEVTIEGLSQILTKLDKIDIGKSLSRALFRMGGLWKRTAVDYAPISPSSSMLKSFSRSLKKGSDTIFAPGRKGRVGSSVKITKFYQDRLPMLLAKASVNRPMPGGLMKSITFRSDERRVECFVPSNSLAGGYAFKIHEEKGVRWRFRGPGTQAKGPQADDKFIVRAANDKQADFTAIAQSEIDKIIKGTTT